MLRPLWLRLELPASTDAILSGLEEVLMTSPIVVAEAPPDAAAGRGRKRAVPAAAAAGRGGKRSKVTSAATATFSASMPPPKLPFHNDLA